MAAKRITVDLVARTRRFTGRMKRASMRLRRFGTRIAGMAKRVARFAAVIGTLAVVAIGIFIKRSAAAIDVTAKLSRQLNINIDSLRGLQRAGSIFGGTTEAVNKALQVMVKRLGEAKQGLTEPLRGLKDLGLSFENLINLEADEQFLQIADAISKLPSAAERATAANQLFGRGAREIGLLLQATRGEIEAMIEKNRELQGSLSEFDAGQVEKMNDAFVDMKVSFTGLFDRITVALAPALTAFATGVTRIFVAVRESILEAGLSSETFANFMDKVKQRVINSIAFIETALLNIPLAVDIVTGSIDLSLVTIADKVSFFFSQQLRPAADSFFKFLDTKLADIARSVNETVTEPSIGFFSDLTEKIGRLAGLSEEAASRAGENFAEKIKAGAGVESFIDLFDFSDELDAQGGLFGKVPKFVESPELTALIDNLAAKLAKFQKLSTEAGEALRASLREGLSFDLGDLPGLDELTALAQMTRPGALVRGSAAAFSASLVDRAPQDISVIKEESIKQTDLQKTIAGAMTGIQTFIANSQAEQGQEPLAF